MVVPQFLDPRLPERFWSKCIPEPNSGCWLWLAAVCSGGYGVFGLGRSVRRVHAVAYDALVGPIPSDLVIDHLCRERSCCNPAHLEPVSRGENVLRGTGVAARCARVTHCPKGHAYDAANTVLRDGRLRICRACKVARASAYYRRVTQEVSHV